MPRPRPQNITIQLPPRPNRPTTGTPGVGGCTPSITGLGWCHYLESERALLSQLDDDGIEFQITLREETPACSSDDIVLELVDGVVDPTQAGIYEFRLLGEACSCVPEWTVLYTRTQLHESNFHTFFVAPLGSVLAFYVASDLIAGSGSGAEHPLGVWSISATCNGQTYGPILMVLTGTGAPD